MTDDWEIGTEVVVKIASGENQFESPASIDLTSTEDGVYGDSQGRLVELIFLDVGDSEGIDLNALDGVIGRITARNDLGITVEIGDSDSNETSGSS
jgi:hypothetical protein